MRRPAICRQKAKRAESLSNILERFRECLKNDASANPRARPLALLAWQKIEEVATEKK